MIYHMVLQTSHQELVAQKPEFDKIEVLPSTSVLVLALWMFGAFVVIFYIDILCVEVLRN